MVAENVVKILVSLDASAVDSMLLRKLEPMLFALIFLISFCIGLALYGISSRKIRYCCI